MSVVAAPADRRFRRAHVKPSGRRHWRTAGIVASKYAVLVVAAGFLVYRGGLLAARTRFLDIDRVVVHGNSRLSTGEVLAALDGLTGESLLRADLEQWRSRLLASPWVKDAALRRSLPATVDVSISEREPIAIGRMNGGLYLLDSHGVVIDEFGPQYADLDLAIVDGLSAMAGGEDGGRADESRVAVVARLLASLKAKPEIAGRVSQIDVTDPHNVAVTLSGDPALIYVGDDRFEQRLESYLELSDTLRASVPAIDYVDLRFDTRVYVRPAGSGGRKAADAKR